jgi:6-phosphogluconolactonase
LENIAFKIAKSIASTLDESVSTKGYATLVVSGGNSPLEIFSHLNQMPIPWSKVTIVLGDDRMLDSDSSDSNDKLIRENLIINNASSAKYLSLIDPLVTPSKLNFPFNISLLGMGLDGHFASLFPELLENISLFEIDAPHEIYLSEDSLGDPSYKRITMNLSMLLNSDRCILLVSSESKRGVLDQAIGDSRLPVHYLINQNKIKIEFSDVDF